MRMPHFYCNQKRITILVFIVFKLNHHKIATNQSISMIFTSNESCEFYLSKYAKTIIFRSFIDKLRSHWIDICIIIIKNRINWYVYCVYQEMHIILDWLDQIWYFYHGFKDLNSTFQAIESKLDDNISKI